MIQDQLAWWVPFINQIAKIAVAYNIHLDTDESFEKCVDLFIQLSFSN